MYTQGNLPGQPRQILIKFRITDLYTISAQNLCLSICGECGDGKRHSDPVIQPAVDLRAVERMAAFDDHAVIGGPDMGAQEMLSGFQKARAEQIKMIILIFFVRNDAACPIFFMAPPRN